MEYLGIVDISQYFKQVDKGRSPHQVIDKLFFEKNGMLRTEFNVLYRSLFSNASHHESIIRELAKKASGLSRAEIIKPAGLPPVAQLPAYLKNWNSLVLSSLGLAIYVPKRRNRGTDQSVIGPS